MKKYVYATALETARSLITHLLDMMNKDSGTLFHIAFSGGSTPSLMFDLWANEYKDITPWDRMRIYWVDERCVPAEDSESNYGTMKRLLLNKVPISGEHIYPIFGSNVPAEEAKRYSSVVRCNVPVKQGLPCFDAILLGIGEDGHTSSIFPGQEHLLISPELYEPSTNPYNGQQRIAMTGTLMYHTKSLIFLATGGNKIPVVHEILYSGDTSPAAYVAHHAWNTSIFVDKSAAGETNTEISVTRQSL